MKKVYVFLAEGFEEVEAFTVVDLLRRAGADTVTVSVQDDLFVTSARNIVVKADSLFHDTDYSDAHMLVLPGGAGGTENLKKHGGLRGIIESFDKEEKLIAAICAAPTILGAMGILKGRRAVCYPGLEEELEGAISSEEDVTVSGHVVTSRALGTAIPFSLVLTELLFGKEKAEEIRKSIVFGA